MKRCLCIREMQVKPTMKYHLTPTRGAIIKVTDAGEQGRTRVECEMGRHCEKVGSSSKSSKHDFHMTWQLHF